ncbi:alpha/beta hydrolase [Saccharothrix sp. SC076]|nr:alpha/beta hydrolase [Saccharothrix obliqua]
MVSADGTRIRSGRTGTGPDVLLGPGLGAVPEVRDGLPARVHTWRPREGPRVALADHVADALAVLDDGGVERCVVAGWSLGVPVAAELAVRHPARVSGLLLVAGDPFAALPAGVRRLVGVSAATALRLAGPLLHRVKVPDVSLSPVDVVRRFAGHDWGWYCALASALDDAPPRPDLTGVTCPTTVLAGRFDLPSPRWSLGAVAGLPQARVRVLPNTHFLPLENPRAVAEELALLLVRARGVERAVADLLTSRSRRRA